MKLLNTPPALVKRATQSLVLLSLVAGAIAMASSKVAISGLVVSKDGKPAQKIPVRLVKPVSPNVVGQSAGAHISSAYGMLVQRSGKGVDEETEKTVASTVTDADGKFQLPEQPPGTYSLIVGNNSTGLARKFLKLETGKPVQLTVTLPR